MSLTTRMLAPIALIMSIALAFVAGSAYDNAKKIVSSNIVTIEATVVEAVSREIEFMLESTRNYMRLSAQRQIVKQYAEWLLTQKKPDRSAPEQKIFLEQINQSVAIYNYVDSLIFLNKQGTVEASTENMGEGQNRSDREYYREAMLGKSSVQGPLITRTKGYYAFFLGEPVFVNGEVSGVLVGAINMDYIASHTIDPVTMHGKGIVYVVDPNGQIILHPDRQKMIGNAMIEQAILEPISDGGAGSFENERDGMAYYSTFNTLPNGWTVIATVSRDFMMSDVQLMRDRHGRRGTCRRVHCAVLYVPCRLPRGRRPCARESSLRKAWRRAISTRPSISAGTMSSAHWLRLSIRWSANSRTASK